MMDASMSTYVWISVSIAGLVALALLHHWASRRAVGNVPGPVEFPILQALPWLLVSRDTLLETIVEYSRKYQRTWTAKWPFSPRMYFIITPAAVEHVLKTRFDNYVKGPYVHRNLLELLGDGIFNTDGELWHTQRKLAATLFSVRQFREKIMDAFRTHGAELEVELERAAASGAPIDMQALFFRFTLDSIGDVAFGDTVGAMADPAVPFARAFDAAQAIVEHRFISPGWQVLELLDGSRATLNDAVRIMDEYSYALIARRRATKSYEAGQDLLSRFMCVKGDDGEHLYLHNDKMLRDVIMNFMIAGRDTTAQALSWCVYNVCKHPKVASSVAQEASTVLGRVPCADMVAPTGAADGEEEGVASAGADSGHGFVSYDKVARQLKYTQAVLQETLRLYPSVPKDIKQAVADDTLPDGTFIPRGSIVCYTPHAMGRLESNWSDAETFDPSRFLHGEKHSAFKFIAFNAGPRTCLGQHMALVEASFVLAVILRNYTLTMVPGQTITYQESLTLPMKRGIQVVVGRRETSKQR